jgi:hypothetical protein
MQFLDKSKCNAKTTDASVIDVWPFTGSETAMCEWLENDAVLGGGYCSQKGSGQAMCSIFDKNEEACNAEDSCVTKRKEYSFTLVGPTVGGNEIPFFPWYTSKFNRCTGCSIQLWVVNPWFRAMLTPVNVLLLLQLVHMNLQYYMRTYAKFLKPLTGRYQEQQQRCAHIAHHQSRKQLTPANMPVH